MYFTIIIVVVVVIIIIIIRGEKALFNMIEICLSTSEIIG